MSPEIESKLTHKLTGTTAVILFKLN
ncbi:Protein of unknown function [Micromonospora lupini str. Lupac 08]|uniref:Uncharacterized protein n=1 Tax=Micromonospora lupini str. Lupac 08 TaxID=1150864 RepID=I0KW20_9ACTN|nr:Protein of unknown function [Micromonospora lupini str. Lupac 08]